MLILLVSIFEKSRFLKISTEKAKILPRFNRKKGNNNKLKQNHKLLVEINEVSLNIRNIAKNCQLRLTTNHGISAFATKKFPKTPENTSAF